MDRIESTWEAVLPADGARRDAPHRAIPPSPPPCCAAHRDEDRRRARLRPRGVAACDVECAGGAAPALRRVQGRAPQPPRSALLRRTSTGGGATRWATLIRLDEIVWGGVRQDGIPPLRNPAMLAAEDVATTSTTTHRVRHLGQRRCPRLPQAHPRLARDVRRHRRRGAGGGRVLHALRHRDSLPHRARRRGPRARHERLPLPLEQAHVRPGDAVAVEHDAWVPGGRTAGRKGHRAGPRQRGDHHLGRVAAAPPRHEGALARHRPRPATTAKGPRTASTSRPTS